MITLSSIFLFIFYSEWSGVGLVGQPKHLWGHWTPVPMPRTGPTTHCIGVYNIMLFTDGCCLEWVRMRCSSKNRKSICRGHCWYCCRAPQINSCVGNTAGIFFNQVFILFHFSLQKRSQKSTVCGLISFLNFNRCSGPASHCCISSHLGYTQTNNDLFPHQYDAMQEGFSHSKEEHFRKIYNRGKLAY